MKKSPVMICPDFKPHAEAILVKAHHAAPLPPGTRVWVDRNGAFGGAISMGCVDQDVAERLRLLLADDGPAKLIQYAEDNELTGNVGLTCGGRIDVLLRRIPGDDPVYAALTGLTGDDDFTLVTSLTGPPAGQQRLYRTGHPPLGSLGEGSADQEVDMLLDRDSFVSGASVHECAGISRLVERHEPPPRLLLMGASAIAVHLCHFAARAGYAVHLVDPRKELARPDRFPDAASIQHLWPAAAFEKLKVDADWYVAVLAHDLKLDTPALAAALTRSCRYTGLLGSAKTQQKHRERLREEGFDDGVINTIRGPVGLDIHAVTPEEIAISILAEIIQTRRPRSRKNSTSPRFPTP